MKTDTQGRQIPTVKYVFTGKSVKHKYQTKRIMAKARCNDCGGRGHIGFNTTTGRYVPCLCLKLLPPGFKINFLHLCK